jgi:hypothetical protein
MYFVLFPRKNRKGEWVRATGYRPGPDTLKHQYNWLTVKEWNEVKTVLSE